MPGGRARGRGGLPVGGRTCLEHDIYVLFHPGRQSLHAEGDLAAEFGQAIVHLGRYGGIDGALHKAICFKPLQRLGQHLFAYPANEVGKLAEAEGTLQQKHHDQRSPT